MIKYFYKKPHEIPIFFDRRLNVRSTAYGESVKSEFIDWRKAFYKSWNNKLDNMLICEQGDIGGNAVRADGINAYIVNSDATEYRSDSVLPPLWWDDRIFEVDRGGIVKINKIKSALNIGTELKAWALVTVRSERFHKGCLAVIGKPLGASKQALSVYDLASSDMTSSVVDRVELPVTLDDKSFLACFGRHVFTVHDSVLGYYYINKQFKLERCAIGADKDSAENEWCNGVLQRVVCDEGGNVFWTANNGVYGFTIGAPRNLVEFGCPVGHEISNIACFDDTLYIYMTDKRNGTVSCCAYGKKNGVYESTPINDAQCNLIMGQSDSFVRYVKIAAGGGAIAAEYSFADKKEKPNGKQLRVNGKGFCCFGELASARYVGYDKRQPVAIV